MDRYARRGSDEVHRRSAVTVDSPAATRYIEEEGSTLSKNRYWSSRTGQQGASSAAPCGRSAACFFMTPREKYRLRTFRRPGYEWSATAGGTSAHADGADSNLLRDHRCDRVHLCGVPAHPVPDRSGLAPPPECGRRRSAVSSPDHLRAQ